MKIFHLAAGLVIGTMLSAGGAQAQVLQGQMLQGKYGGNAEGTDVSGTALHQVTHWTFKHGKLIAFDEIISFPESNDIIACQFVPSTPPPFPYSIDSPANNATIMIGFGCPNPSTNERPESFVIIPERDGKEFSYLEYSTFSSQAFDLDTPAHFSGHAVRR